VNYDSTADTQAHIKRVQELLSVMRGALVVRAERHDASKLLPPEKEAFDRVGPPGAISYSKGTEVTPEYQASLDALKDGLAHHYAHNTHHPEHYPNGIDGFSLLDLVEWFCDIKAAGERYKDGSLTASLTRNKERFKISDQLATILENTQRELGW
jgi:hypothetical protein